MQDAISRSLFSPAVYDSELAQIFIMCKNIVFFLLDISFKAIPQRRRHQVEKREDMLCCAGYYPHLTSHFKAYGTGLIPVSNQDARLKRYVLYFSKNKLEWGFYNWHQQTLRRFTKTASQTQDDGKVTSQLMGILRCHSPLKPEGGK